MKESLAWLPAVFAVICALYNLTRRTWLYNLISLAVQVLAIFLLLLQIWVFSVAIIKLLVGLVAIFIIAFSLFSQGKMQTAPFFRPLREGELFRAFTGLSVILFIFLYLPRIQTALFPNAAPALLFSSLSVMAISLLLLGVKSEPFYVLIGLLGFLTGFELLYASLEYSALLEGLLTVIKLGIALSSPYIFAVEKNAQ